jgi:hypothetical protein
MGPGPLYSFFIPYHLVHFEAPNAIARAVLFRDPTTKPLGGPVVEVCAVAKRDLKAGEVLDDYGMYAVEAGEIEAGHPLPDGPWIFSRSTLGEPAAQRVVHRARQNANHPTGSHPDQQNLFSSIT